MKEAKDKDEVRERKVTLKASLLNEMKVHLKKLARREGASEEQKEICRLIHTLAPDKCLSYGDVQSRHNHGKEDYIIVILGMKHNSSESTLHEILEYDVQILSSTKASEIQFKQNISGRDGGNLSKKLWEISGKGLPSSRTGAVPKKSAT